MDTTFSIVPRNRLLLLLLLLFSHGGLVLGESTDDAYITPDPAPVLRVGWSEWPPYQSRADAKPGKTLGGLDVEILQAAAGLVRVRLEFRRLTWQEQLGQLKQGELDLMMGAFETEERQAFARFSQPYRTETVALFVREQEFDRLHVSGAEELLKEVDRRGLRIGVQRHDYYGPEVEAFLAAPDRRARVVYAQDDEENLARLLDGEVDCFLADRLTMNTIAYRRGLLDAIEHHRVPIYQAPIHWMFGRKTVSAEKVAEFNEALGKLQRDHRLRRITRAYRVPVLLGITVHSPWFTVCNLIGTVAFAVSGVLLARKENYDIFGAFVLSALPALGGGVLRDLLTERHPIGVLRSPAIYLIAVILTVVIGAICYWAHDVWLERRIRNSPFIAARLGRWVGLQRRMITICDALGLATFTVSGVVIAIAQRCEPLWLWGPLLAALTGAGGGILRDIVRADSDNPSLKGSFYPEIALIWGLLLSLFLDWQTQWLDLQNVGIGVGLTILGAFVTRMLVVGYGVRSWMLGAPNRQGG